jgi:hypothetical protein
MQLEITHYFYKPNEGTGMNLYRDTRTFFMLNVQALQ